MEFGFNFFPDVSPQVKSGQQYFREALSLIELGERYGYTHVRTVEHYFQPYGGYSPNPVVFLAAATQRTRTMRLVTGAVLPVFNNPLKLAGELGMLDAISNGRLDIGVARAFLPLEYAAFGVSMDESRERFEEGFAALRLLLSTENASFDGQFHRFRAITSLPRPVQQPHPPLWVAALASEESFYFDCLRTVASLYSMVPIGYVVSNDTGEQAHCAANAWSVHAAYVMSSRTDTRCTRSPRCPCGSAVPSSLASIFFPRRVSITRNHVASNDSVW